VTVHAEIRHEAAADAEGRTLILACGALAREILALIERNGWDHLTLKCLPAILHNRPERIAPAVDAALAAETGRHAAAFVAYADCGTGGALAEVCRRHGVGMIDGPHCYAFFEGTARWDAICRDEATTFYLTDFLVRHFEAFVWKPLGLDRHPELREMYFGNYERLAYLAQTNAPDLDAAAARHAKRLGLAYERRFTGYGDLAPALSAL
jgi:hypothetical protein